MRDTDLLDLLEIVETLAKAVDMSAIEGSSLEPEAYRAKKMCQSFRTAIRQRMIGNSQPNGQKGSL